MGSQISKDSETINWDKVNTNDMSSQLPNINKISLEAQELISKLNLPDISETSEDFNSNSIFSKQPIGQTQNMDDDAQSSSPFISSDMYNFLVNKYNNKSTNMVGGGADEDDSSTSATSSSSKSSSSASPKKASKKEDKKDDKKKINNEKKKTETSEVPSEVNLITEDEGTELVGDRSYEGKRKQKSSSVWKKPSKKASKKASKKGNKSFRGSDNYLSYISSSAHTGGGVTDTIQNENNYTISSVNTSDINMISE
jgi:hypothetical protein